MKPNMFSSSLARFSTLNDVLKNIEGMKAEEDNDHTIVTDFFETNFRKLNVQDSIRVIKTLASRSYIQSLEREFWLFEALEASLSPDIYSD